MRKFYWVYGAIALILIALKIAGVVGWWTATSFIWFPVATVLSISLVMVMVTGYSERMKKKKEEAEKPCCGNCLYKELQEFLKDEQCMGMKNGAEIKDNLCSFWHRR